MKYGLVTFMCLVLTEAAGAQLLPDKPEILDALKRVNEHWIQSHPDPGNNQWARAVYFTGNLDLYKVYHKPAYYAYAELWAENNGWSLNGGVSTRNADNQCAGQVYLDLDALDEVGNTLKISEISECIHATVSSEQIDDWWWIDALYMAMPVFTRLGVLYSDTAYFGKMYRMYKDTKVRRGLFNELTGLWFRDQSFDPPYTTPNGLDCYWSRGNGWVFAAHARVLQLLPESDPHREEYLQTFQTMAQALRERQREDGFWNVSLEDPEHYGGPETSGTSFFTYGMAWGINNGFLDSALYYPTVYKAWNGLVSVALHEDGYLGFIQGVGSHPGSSQPVTYESGSDFGVGAFLLAGSELLKLAPGQMPAPALFSLDSISVVDDTHLRVFFNDSVDVTRATDTENYSLDSADILEVSLFPDHKSSLLSLTPLPYGSHLLTVRNILSATGYPLENGETIRFLYTGNIRITASSYETGTDNRPERSLDYDLGTRWSAEGSGEWILYELEEVKLVTSVEIAFYRGNIWKAFFEISLSSDGKTYTTVFTGESGGGTTGLEKFDFEDHPARFVRITGYGNSLNEWNSITEVRIHTREPGSAVKEISTNRQEPLLYPNPFDHGVLRLRTFLESGSSCRIRIYTLSGKKIAEEEVIIPSGGEFGLGGLKLPSGVYLVWVGKGFQSMSEILIVK